MYRLTLYAITLSAALGFACSKSDGMDNTTPPDPENPPGDFRLTAAIDPITRTEMTDASAVIWKAGDKLSAWIDGDVSNANVELTLTPESDGQSVGRFTGPLAPTADAFTLYAVYPYADYGSDPTAVMRTVPAEVDRCGDVNEVIGVSDFMLARTTLSKADDEHAIGFSHPLALLNIVIDGSNSIFSDGVIESFTMTADRTFVGDVVCNLPEKSIAAADPEAGKTLTINYGADAAMSVPQNAWVAILPADLTDANCAFVLTLTNGQQVTFTVNPKVAFRAQTRYTLTFSDIDGWISSKKAAPKSYDLVAGGGGRANCYIVRNGGYFKFAADYPDRNKTHELIGVTGADWLWSTGDRPLVSNLGYSSKNIYFTVRPGTNGNAVVAAKDDAGDIVWSWHLWMTTGDPLIPTHYTRDVAWSLIDRNLGATSDEPGNPDSYGLYYQWGRKDPFPGVNTAGTNASSKEPAQFSGSTQAYVINDAFSGHTFKSVRNSVMGSDDLAFVTANPTTFVHFYQQGTTGANTWAYNLTADELAALWNGTTNKSKKTIYDPCPAGYCVPVNNGYAWQDWTESFVAFEPSLSGVVYSNGAGNASYYPAAGYRSAGQACNVGYTCAYWAANMNAGLITPFAMWCYGRTTLGNASKQHTQLAFPVRCMKQ